MNPIDLVVDGTGFVLSMTWEGVVMTGLTIAIIGAARWLWWYTLAGTRAAEAKAKAYRDG